MAHIGENARYNTLGLDFHGAKGGPEFLPPSTPDAKYLVAKFSTLKAAQLFLKPPSSF